MFVLQNNVYIVSEKKNHCIYNLNTGKIYAIDDEYLGFINSLISDENPSISDDVKKFLTDEGIITCDSNVLTCDPNLPTCNPNIPS